MSDSTRILLIDDERRILDAFSMPLRDMGYYVKTASEPEEALRLISEERFDIVFIDQFLGPVKGLDLIKEMKKVDHELYYVIITANAGTDLAIESFKNGASDFISKPFFVADLIKSIEYVNKKRELDRKKKRLFIRLEQRVNEKTAELRKVYFSVLSSLAQAMEKKDIGTYGHCRRVSYYSRLIAVALDLNEKDREVLKAAAMLHDIGKIGISDFILGKPGPINEDEMHVIRNHPQKGVEILKPLAKHFKEFESILPAILHHHENYDGSGYPYKLSGEDIPLHARIIAIADTYDAIITHRPYRQGRNHEKAIEELLKCSGKQFDPMIVDAFVEADNKYRHILGNHEKEL